jgi:uncharacterized protein
MILVEVVNSFLVNMGKEFVILLRSKVDERTLPISIGQLEAQSIAIALNNLPFPRPLTHDLFRSVLVNIDCKLQSAIINDLTDETFYAKMIFESKGITFEADSRPSDAIAMALRFSAPIYVEESVMDAVGVVMPKENDSEENKSDDFDSEIDLQQDMEMLQPNESLQKRLEIAIADERYEDAAKIRDEINKSSNSN